MTASPLEVVRAIYDAFNARDPLAALGLLSPEIELVQSGQLPWGGAYRGHEGVLQFLGKLTARISSTVQVERFIIAEAQVVVVGWTTGAVIPTGTPFRVPIAHLWTVVGGLATRVHFIVDNAIMLAALSAETPGVSGGEASPVAR